MFTEKEGLYIAHGDEGAISIVGKMANRHGLVAGATGTGKTVTLQVLAESFSQAGVPCFMADMKGDLSGIAKAGSETEFIRKRAAEFGVEKVEFGGCPVRFYDVMGELGHAMRATVSDMGPQLLSRLLGLNDTQSGVLGIVFQVADDNGWLLIDMKDLRAMLDYVNKHGAEYSSKYGNIASASVGAIQRSLLQLEQEGAEMFFGEPAFDIMDLLATENGRGVMSVLAAERLMLKPKLYSTFMLWLMSCLYARLPEVGDLEKPRLVFFFDEAHMLFDGTSSAMVEKIEQVIRLIRSKGVGIYFVTQSPTDIPENILGQLGNRIQHALRAYTPKDQKAVRAAAETFRVNPKFKTEEVIQSLATGEALISFLDEKGAPSVVQRAKVLFPLSQIGALTDGERNDVIRRSSVYGKYDKAVDRESAFEVLLRESEKAEEEDSKPRKTAGKQGGGLFGKVMKAVVTAVTASVATMVGTAVSNKITGKKSRSTGGTKGVAGRVAKNATSAATRQITRSLLGSLMK